MPRETEVPAAGLKPPQPLRELPGVGRLAAAAGAFVARPWRGGGERGEEAKVEAGDWRRDFPKRGCFPIGKRHGV